MGTPNCSTRTHANSIASRQGVRVSRITDGDDREGLPPLRDGESLPRLVRIEAGHLVNHQAASRGFHGQQGRRRSGVVLCVAVGGVIRRESQPGHGHGKRGSRVRPTDIKLYQSSKELLEICFVLFCRHNIGPRLFIKAGGRPPRRLKQAAENLLRDGLVRKGARTPAVAEQFVDGSVVWRRFLHIDSFCSGVG
jgi:hypothetical protein